VTAMLHELFYWVLNMSITAAITGIPVLLIRMSKKVPGRLLVILWAIPFLRMAIPFGINSPYSLMSLLSGLSARAVSVFEPADRVAVSMMNCVTAAETYFPVTYETNALETLFRVTAVIWLAVAAAILLTLFVLYCSALGQWKDAVPLHGCAYRSDKATVPAVYGIRKPRIILPPACIGKHLDLILLHEQTHIRRGDNLWRLLACIFTAVHWFNPLCWLFLKLFLADLELACDESVLVKLGPGRAKEYARTLLDSRQSRDPLASSFGGSGLPRRIKRILSFRKLTWFSLCLSILWLSLAGYVLLTNAG